MNQSGSVVYGPGQYSRDYGQQWCGRICKISEQAKADPRVQGNPLVIRGSSVSGSSAADLVVSNVDAGKIASRWKRRALGNCRVMFVLD